MGERTGPPSAHRSALIIIIIFALLKLGLHVAVNLTGGYGYFRDELYYLACAGRLDWGYVDQPPLSLAALAGVHAVAGDGLTALRFLPALAGALTVAVAGLVVRRLGGGVPALLLTLTAILVAPVLLAIDGFYSMNSFDLLFWTVILALLIEVLRGGSPRLWIWIGVAAGLGLQNKVSVGFLLGAVLLGLLLTPARTHLRTRWVWAGLGLALLIFIPHLLWQALNGWPTLEFMTNARTMKNVALGPLGFLGGQLMDHHPLSAPVWTAGVLALLFVARFRGLRPLGIAYCALLILFIAGGGKVYYLTPFFPVLFAAGAVALERWIPRRPSLILLPSYAALLVLGGVATLPMTVPVLPVERFLAYQEALGVTPQPGERTSMGRLPQHYADRFGWEEKAAAVVRVWSALPEEERSRCAVYADNYGRCAALDLFGRPHGLPPAIGGHNNYWLWGPGASPVDVVIVLGGSEAEMRRVFHDVRIAETVTCDLCMPYEAELHVFVCRRPKEDLRSLWPRLKKFI